ncbi:MAG TPA: cation-translocating P-type ATPase [Rhizomicrobium sp.]|jgi:heavy metal translocating P-type ATPase|nr:cation-translocating P-type ATPase [Rhizomicrobium sp.]
MNLATPLSDEFVLLNAAEKRKLAWRLALSLAAAGCLIVSIAWKYWSPAQGDVAEVVAGIAAVLVGVPALLAAWRSLRYPDLHGITDQLIALAFIAAWVTGDLITATLLPLIMMVGHILEERSLLGSHEAIRALTKLTETTARRFRDDGEIEEIPAVYLRPGDRVEVRAGDSIPGDGVIETGTSSVDTATITGESVPLDVAPGSDVFSGSINLDGLLMVRIVRVGEETTLGRVIALMQEAERTKPAVTRLLERYAERYMIFVLLMAACLWFLTGSTTVMLAVLVASCPCALVLAAPATSIAAIAVAGRHGILVKGAAFLEQLASVDSVMFDKTGTLTSGQLRLTGVALASGTNKDEVIRLAGSLGAASSHPVSRALAAEISDHQRLSLVDMHETRGLGVTALLGNEQVALGRLELFRSLGIAAAPPAHNGPVAGVSKGTDFLGWLLLADEIRPEAKGAIAELKHLGLQRQLMITGDRSQEAHRVAAKLNLHDVRAEALPAEKMELVLTEIRQGRRPMVVGDGINDALALKAGAVGIAMGAQGTDVALASADLVLMSNDLRRLGTCIRLSRRCRSTILVNVGVGLGWTVILVILAAANALGPSGALMAAILHNAGTIAVMGNAGRLLKFQDRPAEA